MTIKALVDHLREESLLEVVEHLEDLATNNLRSLSGHKRALSKELQSLKNRFEMVLDHASRVRTLWAQRNYERAMIEYGLLIRTHSSIEASGYSYHENRVQNDLNIKQRDLDVTKRELDIKRRDQEQKKAARRESGTKTGGQRKKVHTPMSLKVIENYLRKYPTDPSEAIAAQLQHDHPEVFSLFERSGLAATVRRKKKQQLS